MKKFVLSLLFLLCCTITGAQKKSEVFADIRKTVEEYFMPDFNDAIEFPEWRNPNNGNGLIHCSSIYIEPNHFFRNGKVCSSYAAWLNQYCSQNLHDKVIEHILTLDGNLQKVKGDNDLYQVGATLERKWVNEEGPDIPAERITLTVQWRGGGKLVYIMHLDGAIRPVQLPKPVVVTTLQQTAETVATADNKIDSADNQDYISDSSRIGYLFEEVLAETAKDKFLILFNMASFFISLVMYIRYAKVKWAYWTRRTRWKELLGFAGTVTGVAVFFNFFIWGEKMYKGNYKPNRIRLEHLEAYDSYRLAVPHKAVAVAKDGKWGLVNFAGQVTCPLQLDTIGDFQQDVAIVQSDGLYAFLHADGTDKFEWLNHITPFREGRSLVELRQKNEKNKIVSSYYLFDLNAEIGQRYTQLPYKHIFFWNSSEVVDRYTVSKDDKYGIIDGQGRVIVPLEYDEISAFYQDGMVRVQKNGGKWSNRKYGYINLDGELVIPLQYRWAKDFSEGLAAVENDKGLVGYIDKQGNLAIPFRYIDGQPFKNGRAVVRANIYGGPYGAIDTKGNWILKPEQHWESNVYKRLKELDNK